MFLAHIPHLNNLSLTNLNSEFISQNTPESIPITSLNPYIYLSLWIGSQVRANWIIISDVKLFDAVKCTWQDLHRLIVYMLSQI